MAKPMAKRWLFYCLFVFVFAFYCNFHCIGTTNGVSGGK